MRTRPMPYDDSHPHSSAAVETPGTVAGVARRIGARILHEAREALPPTLFFLVGFHFIVFTTNLLVAQYAVAVSTFMLATIAALVVGKAVLVANAIPLLRRYDRAPLIQPILYKTAFYWVIVFFARLLERFVHFAIIERNPPGDFAGRLIEAAGLKGKRIGHAQISERHANFIVNLGGAKAQDVHDLMDLAGAEVTQRFGVELIPEVRLLGEWRQA